MKSFRFFLLLLVSFLLIIACSYLLSRPLPQIQPSAKDPRFDQARAFEYVRELVTDYPQRDIWHEDNKKAAVWLRQQLSGFGLDVQTQQFSQYVKDEVVEGQENVYAISRGTKYPDEYILIAAHYDIPPYVTQGAADNASGVGASLELARIFSAEPHDRSIIFLMTDSEEYGAMWGMLHFLNQFEDIDKVKVAIILDFLNMGEMKAISLRSSGLQQGYTPLWLREVAVAAAENEFTVAHTKGPFEWIERSVAIASTEAGVVLQAGIPAINLSAQAVDRTKQLEYFHTTSDTFDKLDIRAMGYWGRAVERILRSVDELPVIPNESMYYFRLQNSYLPNWVVLLIQLLAFIPLAYAVAALSGEQKQRHPYNYNGMPKEIMRFLALFIAGVAGFIVLKILPYTPLMVRYELYPATQKDPVLYNPQFIPLLLVVLTFVLVYMLLQKVFRLQQSQPADWTGRKLALLFILLVTALLVIIGRGGFAAVVFLLVPAILWPLIFSGRNKGHTVLNLLIAVISNAVFFFFIYMFSTLYDIGVMWWYLMMGAAYGLFSVQSILAVIAGFALYARAIKLAWNS